MIGAWRLAPGPDPRRIAAETRLPAPTLEKVLRLLDALQAIVDSRPAMPVTGILVIDLHEVLASKRVTLFDRRALRDLFHARRILETQTLNARTLDWSLIREGVLAWRAAERRLR